MLEEIKIIKQLLLCHCEKCEMPIYPGTVAAVGVEGKRYHQECLEDKENKNGKNFFSK